MDRLTTMIRTVVAGAVCLLLLASCSSHSLPLEQQNADNPGGPAADEHSGQVLPGDNSPPVDGGTQLPVDGGSTEDPVILDPVPDPGNPPESPPETEDPLFSGDYDFSVTVYDESYRRGGSASDYSVRWHPYEGEMWWSIPVMEGDEEPIPLIEVEVVAHDAADLRLVFMDLQFDNTKLAPEYATPAEELGAARLGSPPGLLTRMPGNPAISGLVSTLVTPGDWAGLSGSEVVVARYYFGAGSTNIIGPVRPLMAPRQPDSKAQLSYSADNSELDWLHSLTGDYDQSGTVDMFDFGEIGYFFGSSSEDADSLAAWITSPGMDAVNVAAISPMMQHLNESLEGYNVYRGSLADYPDGGSLLGSVTLADAVGEWGVDRLAYSFPLAETPAAGDVFWVRPYLGTEQGIASDPLEIE